MFDIASRIIELCKKNKIESINELSNLSGVPQSTLATVMKGNTSSRVDTIERLCEYFEITLSEFFSESNPELFDMSIKMKNLSQLTGKVNELLIKKVKSLQNASDYVEAELENLRDDFIREYSEENNNVKQLNAVLTRSFDEQLKYMSRFYNDVITDENDNIIFTNNLPNLEKLADIFYNLKEKDREMVFKFMDFLQSQE